MTSKGSRFSLGLFVPSAVDIRESIQSAHRDGYDFIFTPIFHPHFERAPVTEKEHAWQLRPLTRSDLLMQSYEWTNYVVGKLSDFVRTESPKPNVRANAREILLQELRWACHLQLSAVVAPEPQDQCANYANILNSILVLNRYTQIYIHLPMTSYRTLMLSHRDDSIDESSNSPDPWLRWNKLRMLCQHHPHLALALELTEDLPDEIELLRWISEPIRMLLIPIRIFQYTSNGVNLPPAHAAFIQRLFRHKVQFVIFGTPQQGETLSLYSSYIAALYHTAPQLTQQEQYEQPYWDYLQQPLQPLMDNLESSTYETFERDTPKYAMYEEAIFQALNDFKASGRRDIVVMVVGAGRGPIVDAAIRAERRSKVPIHLYALDKNPHALVTLRNRQMSSKRWSNVHIVHSDMREWNPPVQADILVSELLGSFGDNELSPECLQGAERLLKPDGISIPAWYKSFVAPLSSTKLYNSVVSSGIPSNFETPHVVKIHAAHIWAEAQPVFYFEHPTPKGERIDNNRYISLKFKSPVTCLLHGFAGYFDCCLYKNVHVSIHPANHTPNMSSWFPMYFPLREPIFIHEGETIEVNFWRYNDGKKVWYEWSAASPNYQSPIHNPNGRSYWIGL